jgi:hypothetical protein
LTASDFQPTSNVAFQGKCTPATSVSVLTARICPAGTGEQRRIIADAEAHVLAPAHGTAVADAGDQVEFVHARFLPAAQMLLGA